jgi:Family of unknown function (DUF6152)
MNSKTLGLLSAMAAAGTLMPAVAHHSYSMFALDQSVTIKGTVKEFRWTNPHAWILMMVPDAQGKPEQWSIQMGSPGSLTRRGWNSKTIASGDNVSMTLHPVKDGTHGGEYTSITLPSGKVLNDLMGGQHTGENE